MAKKESADKYKWEFLRRNKEYCQAYKKILRVKDKEALINFSSEWGLKKPINPTRKFEQLAQSDKISLFYFQPLILELDQGYDVATPLISGDFILDIQHPKKEIMAKFEAYIDEYINNFNKVDKDKRQRNRLEEYQRYLDVYDLKNKGWGWDKLAERFYKSDTENGRISYARMKIKRDFNRCKKLIDGGFNK